MSLKFGVVLAGAGLFCMAAALLFAEPRRAPDVCCTAAVLADTVKGTPFRLVRICMRLPSDSGKIRVSE